MDVAVYKRSFDPEHDVVIIVTGKDVDWIEAVKNEMIQTLDFLVKFDKEGVDEIDDTVDQTIVASGKSAKKTLAEVEQRGWGHHGGGWGHH